MKLDFLMSLPIRTVGMGIDCGLKKLWILFFSSFCLVMAESLKINDNLRPSSSSSSLLSSYHLLF